MKTGFNHIRAFMLLLLLLLCTVGNSQHLDSGATKVINAPIKKVEQSVGSAKQNLKTTLGSIKKDTIPKIAWKKPIITGRVGLEGYYTTFQNPRVLSAPQYLRFSATPTISWFGLPFAGDIYQTTEKNTLYNSNHVRFRFDVETFQRNLKLQFQHKLQEQKAKVGNDLGKLNDINKINSGLEQQKDNLLQQQNQLGNTYQNKLSEYKSKYSQEAFQKQISDSINGYGNTAKNQLQDSANIVKEWMVSKAKDSATLERLHRDSQVIAARINQIKEKKEELEAKKIWLDSMYKKDTALVNKYAAMVENPQAFARKWAQENEMSKSFLLATKIKDFQIGNVQLFIHDYSLSGNPMRGYSSTFGNDESEITTAIAKAIPNDILHYNRENSKYERWVFAIAAGYKFTKWLEVKPFIHYMSDDKKAMVEQQKPALKNTVFGLNILTDPYKLIKLDISAAQSRYEITNQVIKSITYPNGSNNLVSTTQLARSAYRIMGERSLGKFTLNASTQYVGPLFKNLGNPYMRANFREEKIKMVFKGFGEQLSITGSYKSFRDNPLDIAEVTNKIQGYGISAQTKFKNKKLPNFNASISPYEQGNNHPDSLFRINNRFSVYAAGMSYRLNKGFFKYNLMAYGTQSNMQIGDSLIAIVRTITINQDISLGRNITLGITGTIMRTFPGVDSSQANIYQARSSYRLGKFATLTATGSYSQFLNGAYRKGASLILSTQTGKHLKISLRSGYDHYYKLWGLGNQEAFWGLCRLDWVW